MKQFVRVLLCLVTLSILFACAPAAYDKRGYGGKKSLPKPAQEEVVPKDDAYQPR